MIISVMWSTTYYYYYYKIFKLIFFITGLGNQWPFIDSLQEYCKIKYSETGKIANQLQILLMDTLTIFTVYRF